MDAITIADFFSVVKSRIINSAIDLEEIIIEGFDFDSYIADLDEFLRSYISNYSRAKEVIDFDLA